jgi:hypothetical protein
MLAERRMHVSVVKNWFSHQEIVLSFWFSSQARGLTSS